jgi:hypothetical protein
MGAAFPLLSEFFTLGLVSTAPMQKNHVRHANQTFEVPNAHPYYFNPVYLLRKEEEQDLQEEE